MCAAQACDGDGGYVFRHNDLLFQGESNFGVMYDFADPTNMSELARFELPGDLDTITPMGNVAVVSVDEKGDPGQATGIFPYDTVPDTVAPAVRWHRPADGQQWVKPTTAIGIALDEQVEPRSAHAGSIRVWTDDGAAVPARRARETRVSRFATRRDSSASRGAGDARARGVPRTPRVRPAYRAAGDRRSSAEDPLGRYGGA